MWAVAKDKGCSPSDLAGSLYFDLRDVLLSYSVAYEKLAGEAPSTRHTMPIPAMDDKPKT